MSEFTSIEEFDQIYSRLFLTFKSGKTKRLAWRKWQLKQLWWMVNDNEERIVEALHKDLNRHRFETYASDILGLKKDILEHIANLERWAADEYISEAGFVLGTLGKARIRKEPLGVSLIIGAWNFPFLLLLQPVIAAVAAGCCVLMKPSELSVASQTLLEELVAKYLDANAISLVTGGPAETSRILERKFDHVFFTGSSKIARFITQAAAKHLTPTVLELGGQGPAIVTKTADVDLAAKRIAYAKFLNAGQICLTVNHVFADPAIYDELIQRLTYWNQEFLKSNEEGTKMATIVNRRNLDRLGTLLEKSKGRILAAGDTDRKRLFMYPTVVADVKPDDSLLEEELFGPVCPVIKSSYFQAYTTISQLPHPLAIYIFSRDQAEINKILDNTNSGGVTINDVLMHAGVPTAPFGGVGDSGFGYYHGKYGFDAFTHKRVVVAPPTWLEKVISFRYPPFKDENIAKVNVKNKLGFKRGETMEDQNIGKETSLLAPVGAVGIVIVATVVATYGKAWLLVGSKA